MPFPYYTGLPVQRDASEALPVQRRSRLDDAAGYMPDPELVDAVNVALLLGQPLLLTGEPGTGKTQLAYSVAWSLRLGRLFVFDTKSSSAAKDLFYSYDTLGRFHAAETREGSQDSLDYITYNALGAAILLSRRKRAVEAYLPPDFRHDGPPRRSVVLIDEIDKAPRDFPNDLLNEIEKLYFRVPELRNVRLSASKTKPPIIIITSNSEKHLPDAFLRRCVYYHIEFPTPQRLKEIALKRVSGLRDAENAWLADALDLFDRLRSPDVDLDKRPATAELLGWLSYLHERGAGGGPPLRKNKGLMKSSIGVLIKTAEDGAKADKILSEWAGKESG